MNTTVSSGSNSSIEEGLMVPLRHASSSMFDGNEDDPAEKNKGSTPHYRSMLFGSIFWMSFGLFGWYFPRFLIALETSIKDKPPPYQQTAAGDVILDFELNQPLVQPATVDSFLLKSTALYIPFLFLVIHAWTSTPRRHGGISSSARGANNNPPGSIRLTLVSTAVSAFSMAIGLSEGITVMIKLWVQRRRPNFYALCGFDISTKSCMADLDHVREANFSFPSGHSSLICCSMIFLIWYLHGHYDTNAISTLPSTRLCALFTYTLLPFGWAMFVAASRLVDTWHHPSDVVAGLGLGFAACTVAYHSWYPPIWSMHSGLPRSIIMVGRTSRSCTASGSRTLPSSDIGRMGNECDLQLSTPTTKGV
ncbi:PAP2 superfamily protein [Nitzschia inconspicua]|uniref:PAP2 superfamily protein n=1 Tax=Nitzschia inconspicua TaxID=303405 RepID=A0A9K3PJZ8_9STRA|nr:PAP2 superfamily protein [Nitzschia inconspicua]